MIVIQGMNATLSWLAPGVLAVPWWRVL